jgi:hypothetical protein
LTQKLNNIESELANASQLQIDKEEEITMRYLEKESKFMHEMQELRATAEKAQKEAEVRERQFKKMQIKIDEQSQQY